MIDNIERKANNWIYPQGEGATTCRAALLACLAMQKNTLRGQAINVLFCYANQTNKTTLQAVQQRFLG